MTTTVLISLCGLVVTVVSFLVSRMVTRKVRVTVHRAVFVGSVAGESDHYFINVTNLSLNREVEITHIWVDTPTKIHISNGDRPLPKRLKVDEIWSTWVPVSVLPSTLRDEAVYKLARVQLSSGGVFRSKRNKTEPEFGSVPGGASVDTFTGQMTASQALPDAGTRSLGSMEAITPGRAVGLLQEQLAKNVEMLRFDDPAVYEWWSVTERILEKAFGAESRQANQFSCEISYSGETAEESQERHVRTIAEKKGMLREFATELELFSPRSDGVKQGESAGWDSESRLKGPDEVDVVQKLSSGNTPAKTPNSSARISRGNGTVAQAGPVIPTASATTRAVTGASPVIITVRTPRPCNWAMSAAESSRGGSLSAITPAMRSGSVDPTATTRTRKPLA